MLSGNILRFGAGLESEIFRKFHCGVLIPDCFYCAVIMPGLTFRDMKELSILGFLFSLPCLARTLACTSVGVDCSVA